MNAPSEIIRQLLIDLGLGAEENEWTTYVGFLPDKPDNAICVYDTAGKMDGRLMVTGEQIEHPGVQIRVRGLSYSEVWNKATAIALNLDAQRKISVVTSSEEAYIVHNVSRSGAIIPIGIEDTEGRRRHHFTINMILTLQRLGEHFPLALASGEGSILLSGQTH